MLHYIVVVIAMIVYPSSAMKLTSLFSFECEKLVHCSLSILFSFVHFIPVKLGQNQFTSMTVLTVVIELLLFGANR